MNKSNNISENENMQQLLALLSRVLGIDISTITDETSPDNTETWDSFNGLMMVSELEREFDVHFTMDEVVAVTCVKDIKEALKKHGIAIE
jgi:acyl carrier protein